MNETNTLRVIALALSRIIVRRVRVFRNNVGQGWVGKAQVVKRVTVVTLLPGDVIVRQARPLHAGLIEGSSDLIGWTSVVVGPEHVGQTFAVFTAIEGKSDDGRERPAQKNFREQVTAAGGIATIARDRDEAIAACCDFRNTAAGPTEEECGNCEMPVSIGCTGLFQNQDACHYYAQTAPDSWKL